MSKLKQLPYPKYLYKSATYKAWSLMKNRCNNPNYYLHHRYGGRGIAVCDRWLYFSNFLKDMGERPDGLSLDRIDNNMGYSPDNCRWSTMQVQQNNRQNNHHITYKEKTQTIAQWAKEIGVDARVLGNRVYRGWSINDSIELPFSRNNGYRSAP